MNVIVFGGAGFVGRHLSRELIKNGHDVIICDNLHIRPEGPIPSEAEFFKKDAGSVNQTAILFNRFRPEVVFWLVAHQGYRRGWAKYARTNIAAVYSLFEAINRINGYRPELIVHASSQAIYTPTVNAKEDSSARPFSIYGKTKIQQEDAFRLLHGDIRVVGMRYSIILGAGQSLQTTETGVLRNWLFNAVQNKPPLVYGDGLQIRDFVHIEDVTRANIKAMEVVNSAFGKFTNFNISGPAISIGELSKIFCKHFEGALPESTNSAIRPGGEYTLTSSSERAKEYLDWESTHTIEEMVRDFVEFGKKKVDSTLVQFDASFEESNGK